MVFQAVVMLALAIIVFLLHNIAHNLAIGIQWILQAMQQKGDNDGRKKAD